MQWGFWKAILHHLILSHTKTRIKNLTEISQSQISPRWWLRTKARRRYFSAIDHNGVRCKWSKTGKKILSPVQWSDETFWHIWIWQIQICTWLSHKLYHMICTGAALWEPITFLQRTSSQTWKGDWTSFFCRTVITISILMKIWKMIKAKILIVAAAVPFQIQSRNPEPWHVEHNQGLTRNSTSRLQRNDIMNKLFEIVYFQRARRKKWSYGWSDSRIHTACRPKIKRWKETT